MSCQRTRTPMPILLASSCGRRPRGGLWNGPKFGSQPQLAIYGVSNSLFKWRVKLQVLVDVKQSLKTSQRLILGAQPTKIGHVCTIIPGHNTLATKCLFTYSIKVVASFLNWTPIFHWYVVWWRSKSKHHRDTCLKDIGMRQKYL